MNSQLRAALACAGLCVVLSIVAVVVGRYSPEETWTKVPSIPPSRTSAPVNATPPSPPGTAAKVPRLLQHPTLSQTQIAFDFAGEIWLASRDGGDARRLVTGQLENSRPYFSPDGTMIAYTGTYDDNTDVYVVPAAGGEPRRITYYPGLDQAEGWTPDGKSVLIVSTRAITRDLPALFTVPAEGGPPVPLPLPSGAAATFSPDGQSVAYVPYPQWQPAWKKYRGGQTTPIWIASLADSHITKVPRDNSNDRFPMWAKDTVYFVSDRNGHYTLFSYDTKSQEVRELVKNPDGFDVRSASLGPDAIVYEQLGKISIYDLAAGQSHVVPITISADLPQTRATFMKLDSDAVLRASVSPTGKRVLFEAHGEILSVPVEKGDVRNLTRSPGVADRYAEWSPDGKWIASLSDETGEYALYLRTPDGLGPVKKIDLGSPGSYFYAPRWSPDSKKLVLFDKHMNLWLIDSEHPTPVKVDTQQFETNGFDAHFSPDSQWIAYIKELPSHFHAVFAYSLADKSIHQLTDGRSDAQNPRFDAGGKYLWFLASTDVGVANTGGMTGLGRPVTSSVYGIVLKKALPSPTAPESDEEGADAGAPGGKDDKGDKGSKPAARDAKPDAAKIDLDGIDQRIVALPIDRANYAGLEAGTEGVIFLLSQPIALADEDYLELDDERGPPADVVRFDLKPRKTEKFAEGVQPYIRVSADGSKVLFQKDKTWFVVGSESAPKPGDGELKVGDLDVWVDPRAEWHQLYHEVWRIEREFLYDPNAHGLDLAAAEKLYAPYVDGIASRQDLNDLLEEGLGNLVLGHVWAQGGTEPKQEHVGVGLLGADYTVSGGRFRISRILRGENWNPRLRAPLTQPGVDVKEGDYLIAVNGRDVAIDSDVSRAFLGTAGKQTVITVSATPDGGASRQVTVVPVGSESRLRLRTWMEDSKRTVDKLSGGRVGYVFIPDTGAEGFTNFNRYYFSQAGKDAVILDERFNHGGFIADYIVNILQWTPLIGLANRDGDDVVIPAGGIFGPKVMIANQMSGSGGDALPWLFKRAGLGPLVGVRTWGGLVGIGGYPSLIDGGSVTAPRVGLYGTKGQWEVENVGIAPDVEVEQDPALIRQGHDPQLERAVQLALDALAKNPPQKLVRPPFPNYGPRLPKPDAP